MLSTELEFCLNEAFQTARNNRHEFLTVEHLADHKAGQISGGQKKLLELGRTIVVGFPASRLRSDGDF